MKKITVLATGGTIASVPTAEGYAPGISGERLLSFAGSFTKDVELHVHDILSLDSSNIQPEEWKLIAKETYSALQKSDGVIITHGTDTMAYTAAMLSYMLRGLDKTVVLTGSQLPMEHDLTDARINLTCAVRTVCTGVPGVYVVFNRKVINGTRAIKLRTESFDAFDSVNAPLAGVIDTGGVSITHPQKITGEKSLQTDLVTDVFLLKAIPGTSPALFDSILAMGYRGVVIEAFGVGGLHFIRRNLLEKINMLADSGVPVVITSQCLYEFADMSVYEVGRKFAGRGVINGRDITSEAAVTKLMWALAHTSGTDELTKLIQTSLCGEITEE